MKKINKIFAIILLFLGFSYLIKFSIEKNFIRIMVSLCVPILVILPKILKNKLNDKLVFIYYLYVLILMILGCLARFYSIFKYYDMFAHFMFGFLSSVIALYILNIFKLINKNIVFNIIFILSITLALASLWEVYEYIASIIVKDDIQHVLTTGVSDTMEDIMASLIASILFVMLYVFKKDKINLIVKCQE